MVVIDTVLLKVASRCNLNCNYCYVYNMGDSGWRRQPRRLSEDLQAVIVKELQRLFERQERPFSIVLHGGEPLLLGMSRLHSLFEALREAVPACGLHVQTNGTLLNNSILDTCAEHHVGISVSLDGPQPITDQFRMDHRGRGSFSRVWKGIELLRGHQAASSLFSGILAVIDPRTDPAEVYHFLKDTGAPSIDFLYRDGNYDVLPFGKASPLSTEYGDWMRRLLDIYLADPAPPRIRVLDDLIKLCLGGSAMKEGIGVSDYGIVVIDTDGSIAKNDTLKSTSDSADTFASKWSVVQHSLADVVRTAEFQAYHEAQQPAADTCRACPDLAVCGGGMPAHRWSAVRGLDNPSVFCVDQRTLIARIREWIAVQRGEAA